MSELGQKPTSLERPLLAQSRRSVGALKLTDRDRSFAAFRRRPDLAARCAASGEQGRLGLRNISIPLTFS
jgi:hypothetical protein